MRVSKFFRETASWEALTGSNSYSGDSFAAAVTIYGAWSFKHQLVRTSEGKEVVSPASFSTKTNVGLGDRITDPTGTARRVVNRRVARDVRRNLSHYVVDVA